MWGPWLERANRTGLPYDEGPSPDPHISTIRRDIVICTVPPWHRRRFVVVGEGRHCDYRKDCAGPELLHRRDPTDSLHSINWDLDSDSFFSALCSANSSMRLGPAVAFLAISRLPIRNPAKSAHFYPQVVICPAVSCMTQAVPSTRTSPPFLETAGGYVAGSSQVLNQQLLNQSS